MNRETAIENAIMGAPKKIGFADAVVIRNVRVHLAAGRVDLMLLPKPGRIKLVLVEAKATGATDAASKVIGQLLMYYAGALKLGTKGLALMRRFAEAHPDRACSTSTTSPKAMTGGVTPPSEAWQRLEAGRRLRPSEIALFIAVDSKPRASLTDALNALRKHHRLPIGIIRVDGGIPSTVDIEAEA